MTTSPTGSTMAPGSRLQVARRAGLLACSLTVLLGVPHGVEAQITVGRTVQVSRAMEQAAHTEAFIAADPVNPRQLAACSMLVEPQRNRMSTALYLSGDAGATWRLAVHDTVGPRGHAWDPTCGFAPEGTVLLATLPGQGDPFAPDMRLMTRVHRSANGGASWDAPLDLAYLDNEDVAVDWTHGPHRGRIYLVGVRTSRTVPGSRHLSLLYSADGGRTFEGPVNRFPERGTVQGHVGAPVVAPGGDLIVPVTVTRHWAPENAADTAGVPAEAVAIVRVSGGGAQIAAPSLVAAFEACGESGPPVVAVDHTTGPFRGRIYVAYPDVSQGRCQIKLSWSDDGTRWSTPLPVDDPPIPLDTAMGPDAFIPGVAVNDRGVVGITWYDRREDPRNREFRHRFTASADGGHSVMASVPVSEHLYRYARDSQPEALFPLAIRFDADTTGGAWIGLHTGRSNRLYYQVGDYGGLAVRADGAFQPIWIDNRTQVPQLYTAPITVALTARRPEDRDRELGRVVTDSVPVAVSSIAFEPQSCAVRLGIELMNRTGRSVALPLAVRVDQAISQLGVPVAVGSDRDDIGRPILRVGSGGTLAPGARVGHTAEFRLEQCRPLAGRGAYGYREALDARIQGTPTARISGPKMLAVKVRVFEPAVPKQ